MKQKSCLKLLKMYITGHGYAKSEYIIGNMFDVVFTNPVTNISDDIMQGMNTLGRYDLTIGYMKNFQFTPIICEEK